MDDARIGRICRALRRRRRWRQADLAARAGCHQTTVSRLERAGPAAIPFEVTRRIFGALDASFDGLVGWRTGDLDRLLDAGHAALVESVASILPATGPWIVLPEVTYAIYGERGSIDLLAGEPGHRAVVVFEMKTDLTRIEETSRKLDEKVRLASRIANERFGWRPEVVARALVLEDTMTSRRRVGAHEATFRARYPARSREVRAWLREPSGPMSGLWFLASKRRRLGSGGLGVARRVRRPRT